MLVPLTVVPFVLVAPVVPCTPFRLEPFVSVVLFRTPFIEEPLVMLVFWPVPLTAVPFVADVPLRTPAAEVPFVRFVLFVPFTDDPFVDDAVELFAVVPLLALPLVPLVEVCATNIPDSAKKPEMPIEKSWTFIGLYPISLPDCNAGNPNALGEQSTCHK
jgi:hypothetical protein